LKRILVYSHDAYGLGNTQRMLEIVRHLSSLTYSVLLISGSPMIHAFRIPRGVDYIKLPGVVRTEKRRNVVKSLKMGYADVIRLRANLILRAALGYRPDLILVDKRPLGIGNELELALTALHCVHRPPRTVLLLRDILDVPQSTIEEWESAAYHQVIDDFYDKVLIVGTEEVFDAVHEYRFPDSTARKVEYCGYIGRALPAKSIEQIRSELRISEEPLVLVTAGGGADGYALMSAYLRGKARRGKTRFWSLLVAGPEMPSWRRSDLSAIALRCSDVMLKEFSDELMAYMNAADVIVSMGGYNTVCELLTLKKRAIIVPRAVPVKEQCIRAARLHALGLARAMRPSEITPTALLDAVDEELATNGKPYPPLQGFRLDGLLHLAESIERLFGKKPSTSVPGNSTRKLPDHRDSASFDPARAGRWKFGRSAW
jgi:predicted glycosyltransferase